MRLFRRGAEFSIRLADTDLMNSRLNCSEEALASLACERIAARKMPHILIGGLGMGFTLRAALACLPADARVTVAEIMPDVVRWARGEMAALFQGCLDDPRVAIREADVSEIIRASRAAFDAILLDVDNGPEGLMLESNDQLYDFPGLAAAKIALKPGGALGVWSAWPDRDFTETLSRAGFAVEEKRVRANGKGRGARHVVWLAGR